jgi:uncharacterized damage-inducible protein DinB
MLAYNEWANGKILHAARAISPGAFDKVRETLTHTVGTQLYWHANWTGREDTELGRGLSLEQIELQFQRSHTALRAFGRRLTEDEWNRTAAWWQRFGFDAQAPLGATLFQVIYHGIQHRAEVAVVLTEEGCSPGDLDYLVFLRETQAAPTP